MAITYGALAGTILCFYILRVNVGTKLTSEEEVRKHGALDSGECGDVSDEDHVIENESSGRRAVGSRRETALT